MNWRPIETAPKDDKLVLLCNAAVHPEDFETFVTTGFWCDNYWADFAAGEPDDGDNDFVDISPTHWMPIPARP